MMGGGILVWLLLGGIFVTAVGGIDRVKELFQQKPSGSANTLTDEHNRGTSPEDILRERYARGELSREEYLEAQETLAK